LIIQYRMLLSFGLIVSVFLPGQSPAEEPFPAPLPNAAQSAGAPPFSGGGFQSPMLAAPQSGWPESCMAEFIPLREEAERRGKLIKAASDRHASPDEACKLFANFSAAEITMINYLEAHADSCGIPAQIAEQLKARHRGTEGVQKKVCMIAEQVREGPTLTDVLSSSAARRVWPQKGPTGDFDPRR
jgi:hypothetical protein